MTVTQAAGVIDAYIGNLQVCKTDYFETSWSGAYNGCRSLNTENKEDWRLPNEDELKLIYNNREKLQQVDGFIAFSPARYWTADRADEYNYYTVDFATGESYMSAASLSSKVRCVRTK